MLQELISQEIQSALDALLQDKPGGTITRLRLQTVLERTAQRVAGYSRDDILLSLKTSADVAELYQCSKQAINKRANRLKTKFGDFGWQIGPGLWVFTPEEVERLRPGPSGRPTK
jgi:hypothetical protein